MVSNSSCVPVAISFPSSISKILSASMMVDKRWAITRLVRPCIKLVRAFCTAASETESSAEVASSSKSKCGLRNITRAIAMRCFWPPDNLMPFSPTKLLKPSGRFSIKGKISAFSAAWRTASWLASGIPKAILSKRLAENSAGSCGTSPIALRNVANPSSLLSMPLKRMVPVVGS